MAGVKGMKMRMRNDSVSIIMRMERSMEHELRVLSITDKKIIGSMSFNQWLVWQLSKVVQSRRDDIDEYDAKLKQFSMSMKEKIV